MSDLVYLRDLDGTGSMHVCSKGDPGAIAYAPAALPAVSAPVVVRVKPLAWKPMRLAGLHAFCPLFRVTYYADDAEDAARQDATRAAAILAALAPAEATVLRAALTTENQNG